ncbi:MAG: hypothetical protein ACFFAO_16975 [Candidatus Hermodarchaeota archaeon]
MELKRIVKYQYPKGHILKGKPEKYQNTDRYVCPTCKLSPNTFGNPLSSWMDWTYTIDKWEVKE